MSCWDGFGPPDPDEEGWVDSDDGDMPWAPNHVDDPQPWQHRDWTGTPEESMWRKQAEEEGDEG